MIQRSDDAGAGSTQAKPTASAGLSRSDCTKRAAWEAAEQILAGFDGQPGCDLLVLFASAMHREHFAEASALLRDRTGARTVVGALASGVLGSTVELDGRPGLSALALRLPQAELTPFTYEDLSAAGSPRANAELASAIGLNASSKAVLLLSDPFSTPMVRLLPALSRAHEFVDGLNSLPIIGGMASAGDMAGMNRLVLDDRMYTNGAVGVTLSGAFDLSFVVSQGCRAIGEPMIVTKAKRTLIHELAGQPALDIVHETMRALDEDDRLLLQQGLLLGRVINEYKPRFGRGDFLIRSVLGADRQSRMLAVDQPVRVGQTVQLHIRDATTADEDLSLLLDGQAMHDAPAAGLVFTCRQRGWKLFRRPDHDVRAITKACGDIPLTGFFAAGEIGPIGDESFLHSNTASIALFRAEAPAT
ncbi:MAG: FIST C-terminal domain-containing protein [Phycisphaerales bacterium]|nr:FIST C-terminal domain-containing protein [Phycisphaerales bacterium]